MVRSTQTIKPSQGTESSRKQSRKPKTTKKNAGTNTYKPKLGVIKDKLTDKKKKRAGPSKIRGLTSDKGCFRRLPFQRLVREITHDVTGKDYRWRKTALDDIQKLSENFICELFGKSAHSMDVLTERVFKPDKIKKDHPLQVSEARATLYPKDVMNTINNSGTDITHWVGEYAEDWLEKRREKLEKLSDERAETISKKKTNRWEKTKTRLTNEKENRHIHREQKREELQNNREGKKEI